MWFPCCFVSVSVQEQWGHVEEIELVNDGSGLGFGIVGGKATGVVVRTLVPNSIAHKVCALSSSPTRLCCLLCNIHRIGCQVSCAIVVQSARMLRWIQKHHILLSYSLWAMHSVPQSPQQDCACPCRCLPSVFIGTSGQAVSWIQQRWPSQCLTIYEKRGM